MEEKERRFLEQSVSRVTIEKRADGQEYITGRAIVFNQLSQMLGWYREQVFPVAMEGCDISDVVNKFNHDVNFPLGRTPDTLTLEIRADGVYYFTPYDAEDDDHRKVRRKIDKGMVKGSSFEFVIAPGGSDWDIDPETGVEIRTIKKIAKLYDVAPVVFPAYLDTDTSMARRDHDSFVAKRQELLDEQNESRNKQQAPPVEPPKPPTDNSAGVTDYDLDLMAMELEQ